MAEEPARKISFSISSLPSSRHNPLVPRGGADGSVDDPSGEAENGPAIPEFVTSFGASLTLVASEGVKPIIPPMLDTKMKKVIPFPESEVDYDTWKFREDMKGLPEHHGLEEFKQMPVEDFPSAYLAGYGWSKGQVIGRNKMLQDPKVIEYSRRDGTQGLGYNKHKR